MLILDAVTEMLPSTSEVETKDVGACVIRRATATPLAQVSLSPCVWRKRERRAREREREREKRERERERERENLLGTETSIEDSVALRGCGASAFASFCTVREREWGENCQLSAACDTAC